MSTHFYLGKSKKTRVPLERKIHAQLLFFCTLGAVFAFALTRIPV